MNANSNSLEQLPEGSEKVLAVRTMFDSIAPSYDRLNRLLTFRLDIRWRRSAVAALSLESGSTVVDLACGTGDLCKDLEKAGQSAIGIDSSWGMLSAGATESPRIQGDALATPLPDHSIDGITCGFALRNFEAISPFLEESARILRPGGRIAILEVDRPSNCFLRLGHILYLRLVVPWIGGLLSDRGAYQYLPRSMSYLPEASQLWVAIVEAGFTDVEKRRLSGGIAQLLTATRSDATHPERARPAAKSTPVSS